MHTLYPTDNAVALHHMMAAGVSSASKTTGSNAHQSPLPPMQPPLWNLFSLQPHLERPCILLCTPQEKMRAQHHHLQCTVHILLPPSLTLAQKAFSLLSQLKTVKKINQSKLRTFFRRVMFGHSEVRFPYFWPKITFCSDVLSASSVRSVPPPPTFAFQHTPLQLQARSLPCK